MGSVANLASLPRAAISICRMFPTRLSDAPRRGYVHNVRSKNISRRFFPFPGNGWLQPARVKLPDYLPDPAAIRLAIFSIIFLIEQFLSIGTTMEQQS
jgi:hypothetical protein